MTTEWTAEKLAQAELALEAERARAEAAEKDLALNATMLAKQCDLAREAEIAEVKWRKMCGVLESGLRAIVKSGWVRHSTHPAAHRLQELGLNTLAAYDKLKEAK